MGFTSQFQVQMSAAQRFPSPPYRLCTCSEGQRARLVKLSCEAQPSGSQPNLVGYLRVARETCNPGSRLAVSCLPSPLSVFGKPSRQLHTRRRRVAATVASRCRRVRHLVKVAWRRSRLPRESGCARRRQRPQQQQQQQRPGRQDCSALGRRTGGSLGRKSELIRVI